MKLSWNDAGKRFYKTGIDRCVLFPIIDGNYQKGVAWCGLTKVDSSFGGHDKSDLYTGDVKSEILFSPYEYGGTIGAYSYPDEFDRCIGNDQVTDGLIVTFQKQQRFGFCYRKMIGNDTEGHNFGYELHFVYNAMVTGLEDSAETIGAQAMPDELSFEFECIPINLEFGDYESVSRIIVRSTSIDPEKLLEIENTIYGTDNTDPVMLLPSELYDMIYVPDTSSEQGTLRPYPKADQYPEDHFYPQQMPDNMLSLGMYEFVANGTGKPELLADFTPDTGDAVTVSCASSAFSSEYGAVDITDTTHYEVPGSDLIYIYQGRDTISAYRLTPLVIGSNGYRESGKVDETTITGRLPRDDAVVTNRSIKYKGGQVTDGELVYYYLYATCNGQYLEPDEIKFRVGSGEYVYPVGVGPRP